MAGTSATLLARKWESALLVNVDNATLRKILDDPNALEAVMNIEGFRALGGNIFETVIKQERAGSRRRRRRRATTSASRRSGHSQPRRRSTRPSASKSRRS